MTRTLPLLGLALVCGLAAAFATMRLLEERSPGLPSMWTVVSVDAGPTGVRIVLDDGRTLVADTTAHENARAIPLLYPGKTVALDRAADCTRVVPLLQEGRPVLDESAYARLRARGLGDDDLAVAYTLPPGVTATVRDADRTRPAVCATET